jgi:hypothetical protein
LTGFILELSKIPKTVFLRKYQMHLLQRVSGEKLSGLTITDRKRVVLQITDGSSMLMMILMVP